MSSAKIRSCEERGAGSGEEPIWHETVDVLDVSSTQLEWRSFPQPFTRRALIAATLGDKIYVIGGMDGDNEVRLDVDVLDVATGQWSRGPKIPGKGRDGFSPAACTLGDTLPTRAPDFEAATGEQ